MVVGDADLVVGGVGVVDGMVDGEKCLEILTVTATSSKFTEMSLLTSEFLLTLGMLCGWCGWCLCDEKREERIQCWLERTKGEAEEERY